ncbi:MAG: luciferase family protein [Acidimicrobiales bacterium]
MSTITFPRRDGPAPSTSSWAPHLQLDQNASAQMQALLKERVFALDTVEERQTVLSDPRARAIWLRDEIPIGSSEVLLAGTREIGHFHPWDGSMHIALPPDMAEQAIAAGWAEMHPVARAGKAPRNVVMLFGPRTQAELDVLFELIASAIRAADGRPQQPT